MNEAARAWVREIIAEESGHELDLVQPGSKLMEDLGIDSLGLVEIVMTIEERFDVEIPDEEYEGVETVEQIFEIPALRGVSFP